LNEPFQRLSKTNSTIQQGIAAGERVFEILDFVPEIQEKPDAVTVQGFEREICFDDVSFAYDQETVLHHINLVIRKGEIVALVGMSGGGKSTLADLIPRFYDVTGGRVLLDGHDLRDLSLVSLRSLIGVVTQHTFLFNDNIRSNIAYGEPNRTFEEIVDAAKAANAHDFIMRLPQGYETEIGEMGFRLSGGERQRIAIARALLKNAPILILDEATSSLDLESERLVQDAIDRLMADRTTLVIAHRLSTVRRANRIVVIANGRIIEEGRHEDLLARETEYSRLYGMQTGAEGLDGRLL
jgi:subfamily B ATP-binding cassette protein MsbA